MVLYRRNRLPGGSYFFTVTLSDRGSDLLISQVDLLRMAFSEARARRPYFIDAIVILPEHLHTVWTLPQGDDDYPGRWRAIKAGFTRLLRRRFGREVPSPWQSRYWEHTIREEDDYARHVDYIHRNPVKHGYVDRVSDWPYSSFRRFVHSGVYPGDWCGDVAAGEFGEPL